LAPPHPLGEVRQLGPQDGRLDLGDAGVGAEMDVLVLAARAPVVAQLADALGQPLVVRRYGAGVAVRAERLAGIEAVAGGNGGMADRAAVVAAAARLGGG